MLSAVPDFRFLPPAPVLPVLVHWHSPKFRDPADVLTAVWRAWEVLGGYYCAVGVTTTPPRVPWGNLAHVFVVGAEVAWYQLGGFGTGADLRSQGGMSPWVMRGVAWVGDQNCLTARDVGSMIGHEAQHLVGMTEAEAQLPDAERLPILRARALDAARWVGEVT